LNEPQRAAVLNRVPALAIAAGPGSGKTRVITHRLAHEVAVGVPPDRMAAVTFTNCAASEMRRRVDALLHVQHSIHIGTFHWLGQQILRRDAGRLGIRRDFTLLGPAEARRVFSRAVGGERPDRNRVLELMEAVSALKNGKPPSPGESQRGEAIKEAARAYRRALTNLSAIDVDDLLWLSVRLLETDEPARRAWQRRWDEILVDEFQDTNPIQYRVLRLLSGSARLVVVGDDDQAIYGWRYTEPDVMGRFLTDFPGAELVKLEQNYRSTKRILRAADALIGKNEGRLERRLWTENTAGERPVLYTADDEVEEAEWIAKRIRADAERGRDWSDFAVLYRTNAQSRALEDAMVRHGIPYDISIGGRFVEREEIRQAAAYLRLAVNPADDEAALFLFSFVRGIGPRRLEALRSEAATRGLTVLEMAGEASLLPNSVGTQLLETARRVQGIVAGRAGSVTAVADGIIAAVGEGLGGSALERETALENLAELRSLLLDRRERSWTLRDLVDRLSLTSSDAGSEGVRLLSLHAAKGLEYPVVFITGIEEEILPHRRSLDRDEDIREERRLLYVGMTRAAEQLYLSHAHSRLLSGQLRLGTPSRFIAEIGRGHLELEGSSRRAPRPRLHAVTPGERVDHRRWGPGTVTHVEGRGRDTMVSIMFDNGSCHRIQLCHAPLTRLTPHENVVAG